MKRWLIACLAFVGMFTSSASVAESPDLEIARFERVINSVTKRDLKAFSILVAGGAKLEINRVSSPLKFSNLADLAKCKRGDSKPRVEFGGVTLRWDCVGAIFPSDSLMVMRFKDGKVSDIEMNRTIYAPPPPVGFPDPKMYFLTVKEIFDFVAQNQDELAQAKIWTFAELYVAPTSSDHRPAAPFTLSAFRELFAGCKREGQAQVDSGGASISFRCANPILNGLYVADFDFYGQKVRKVWIQSPEDRAKLEKASK